MNDGTEYDKLLKDLQHHAEEITSSELQQLVQKALIAMAFDLKDDKPLPVKPLTDAHNGSSN